MEEEAKRSEMSVADFDSIYLTMPDIHSVPRGKVVAGNLDKVTTHLDMWRGVTMMGPTGSFSVSVPHLGGDFPSHPLRPCLETLTPWPWVSTDQRAVGSVLCDMDQPDGTPDLHCPRQLLKAQLDRLWKSHGLTIKTAFEYEFFVFKEGTLEPVGDDSALDLRSCEEHHELICELRKIIESMGVEIHSIYKECSPGQWEMTTEPYPGVAGADVGFYVKNAVKGFLKKKGYDATFMSRPTLNGIGNGLHLNHSLWKAASAVGKENNAFLGELDGRVGLSTTAEHWIAGLLTHAEALTAVLCPSLNCYRRIHGLGAPSLNTWGLDDRNTFVRARVADNNAFLEKRGVSGAASPYLALAATVAAGMDGLDRRLQCPQPKDVSAARELPRTLAQALTALEEDRELCAKLGDDFVKVYVHSKREHEVAAFEKADLKTEEQQMVFERDMYFKLY